jgi:hypothetical protein
VSADDERSAGGSRREIGLTDAARAEVLDLHEFLVAWFTGAADDTDQVFARFAQVLHPQFSMIVPSGETLDRDAVVRSIRAAHATADAGFAIEIRDLVARVVGEDAVLVTYEERQLDAGQVRDRRVSTAYLVRAQAVRGGVRWRHLHETYRQD